MAKNQHDVPIAEEIIPKLKSGTKEDCINDLVSLVEADPERIITRNYYRVHGMYAESVWISYFGTFMEFKRQANVVLTRQQFALTRDTAKHVSVDHYKAVGDERQNWGDKYVRPHKNRFQTILVCSDLHDIEVDPFYLRVLIDTAKRAQPDTIVINGDLFDLPEFGKYTVDPRDWDVVGRIKFAHEHILAPLRKAVPGAQIDLIESNHENRLIKHLADATPALRAVLSDLHGMTLQQLFGLDKYEINYIAKSDLRAWNKGDINKELAKNYKVYHDCLLVHHYPYARQWGMPGINGHHHAHMVWSHYSPVFGSYEWHQLGSGHKRSASYTEGEKWNNGFALVHIDTHTKSVLIEYIPIADHAVVGGKFYVREKV